MYLLSNAIERKHLVAGNLTNLMICIMISQSFPSGILHVMFSSSYTILEHFINFLDCAIQNFSQVLSSFVLHGIVDRSTNKWAI